MIGLSPMKCKWHYAVLMFCADRVDLSPRTLHLYKGHLSRFFCALKNQTSLENIGKMNLILFLESVSDGQYNTYVCAFRTFFKWASDYYRIEDPAKTLKNKRLEGIKTPRVITSEEYHLIAKMKGTARDQAVFLANTGIRANEFVSLKKQHINVAERLMQVFGKGAKPRYVPLNKTAIEVLDRIKFPKSYSGLRNNMVTLSRRLKIDLFGPHALRHYFATTLLVRGASIEDVSRVLGHSDIHVTIAYYYHPTHLGRTVELLDDLQ